MPVVLKSQPQTLPTKQISRLFDRESVAIHDPRSFGACVVNGNAVCSAITGIIVDTNPGSHGF